LGLEAAWGVQVEGEKASASKKKTPEEKAHGEEGVEEQICQKYHEPQGTLVGEIRGGKVPGKERTVIFLDRGSERVGQRPAKKKRPSARHEQSRVVSICRDSFSRQRK